MHVLTEDQKFIRDLAAYARSRGNALYDFEATCDCAIAQFLRDTGRAREPMITLVEWLDCWGASSWHMLPEQLHTKRGEPSILNTPGANNFRALAERLEALLPFAVKELEAA